MLPDIPTDTRAMVLDVLREPSDAVEIRRVPGSWHFSSPRGLTFASSRAAVAALQAFGGKSSGAIGGLSTWAEKVLREGERLRIRYVEGVLTATVCLTDMTRARSEAVPDAPELGTAIHRALFRLRKDC